MRANGPRCVKDNPVGVPKITLHLVAWWVYDPRHRRGAGPGAATASGTDRGGRANRGVCRSEKERWMTLTRRDVWKLGAPWDPITRAYALAVGEMQQRPPDDPTSWDHQAAVHGVGSV